MQKRSSIALSLVWAFIFSGCMESVNTLDNGADASGADETDNSSDNNANSNSPNLDCSESGSINAGQLDDAAKVYLLCLHNQARSEVALGQVPGASGNLPKAQDMQALAWDAELEQVAQNYANQCTWQHNPNRTVEYLNISTRPEITYVGENLASRSSSNSNYPSLISNISLSFEALMYDEALDWTYGTIGGSETCAGQCGHATQIFWANTSLVGCATASCDNMHGNGYHSQYLVCNYGQGGNYQGLYPYLEATTAGEVCSDDRGAQQTQCTQGLTHSTNYSNGLP